MREERDVDVLEEPGANEVGLCAEHLFRHARPQLQRAGQPLALHDLLHRKSRSAVERYTRIVSLSVAWRARNDRVAESHSRLVRGLGNAVDVRPDRDARFPRTPGGKTRRWDAGVLTR